MASHQSLRREGAALLQAAGIPSSDADARLLLMAAAGFSREDLIIHGADTVAPAVREAFDEFIARRIKNEPVAYIVGEKEFWSLTFKVNDNVLIPRPETEDVVAMGLEFLKNLATPTVLDVGTGSGAILISLLSEVGNARGDGVDISRSALAVAKANAKALGVEERCKFYTSDFLSNVDGKFDLIVSNPPYIDDNAMDSLMADVGEYEPSLALRGGQDGLTAYRLIINSLSTALKTNGKVIFEIGYDQGPSVKALLEDAGFSDIQVSKDLSRHDRIVSATLCNQ